MHLDRRCVRSSWLRVACSGGAGRRAWLAVAWASILGFAAIHSTAILSATPLDEATSISAPDPAPPAAAPAKAHFGFRSLEIFKASFQATGLTVCDLNGDGLSDLVYADNSEGTLKLLYQRRPGEAIEKKTTAGFRTELSQKKSAALNEIESDPRFRDEKFYTEAHINSLAVGDFNGDEKIDFAYYVDPPELQVIYQADAWGADRKRFPVRDGRPTPYALEVGDLNGDSRDDLVLLANGSTYIFYQGENGLQQPQRLHNQGGDSWDIDLADVNADGQRDLVYIYPNEEASVVVRLQGSGGFGPQIPSSLKKISAWNLGKLALSATEEPQSTLVVIQDGSQRVKAFRWKEADSRGGVGSPTLLSLRAQGDAKARRSMFADVNRDGRTDLLTSYPDTAQVEVVFQGEKGGLVRSVLYPTLSGVSGLTAADVDGDGHAEVVVCSSTEKSLGVMHWREGRLQFPQTTPLGGEALLVTAGKLKSSTSDDPAADQVIAVVRVDGKQRLKIVSETKASDSAAAGLAEAVDFELAGDGGTCADVRILDANGDGLLDLLVFIAYESPYLYLQGESEETDGAVTFSDISRGEGFGLGQLTNVEPLALTIAPASLTGDASDSLVVTTPSFVRVLRLEDGKRLTVADQISVGVGDKIRAATLLQLDDDPEPEAVLLNSASSSAEFYDRSAEGTYERSETVKVPSFDITRMEGRDLNGDGQSELLLVSGTTLAILRVEATEEKFEEVWSYSLDAKLDLGQPRDTALGDLNSDGRPDLVLATAPRYQLLFMTAPQGAADEALEAGLSLELGFPIFEQKSYMAKRGNYGPRLMTSADLDHDGLEDLLLLIHDRILLYLQDAPEDANR